MLKFVYGISCWIFTEAIMYLVRLKEALLRLTEFLGVPWNQIFEEKSSPTYPFRTLGQSCFLLQRSLARFTFSVAINERDQQRQKDFRKRVSKNKRSIFATKKSANARHGMLIAAAEFLIFSLIVRVLNSNNSTLQRS